MQTQLSLSHACGDNRRRLAAAGRCLVHTAFLAALASPAVHARDAGSGFVPADVFEGRSEGIGELTLLVGATRPFTVSSVGTVGKDGVLVLSQNIRFEGRPAASRTWVMRRVGAGTYTATLTDAAGPVAIRTAGRRMTLRYPLQRWGLVMHQTLDLAEDGRTIANRGSVRLLGIPIGELRETIRLRR